MKNEGIPNKTDNIKNKNIDSNIFSYFLSTNFSTGKYIAYMIPNKNKKAPRHPTNMLNRLSVIP